MPVAHSNVCPKHRDCTGRPMTLSKTREEWYRYGDTRKVGTCFSQAPPPDEREYLIQRRLRPSDPRVIGSRPRNPRPALMLGLIRLPSQRVGSLQSRGSRPPQPRACPHGFSDCRHAPTVSTSALPTRRLRSEVAWRPAPDERWCHRGSHRRRYRRLRPAAAAGHPPWPDTPGW